MKTRMAILSLLSSILNLGLNFQRGLLFALLPLFWAGCATVGVEQQVLVSKPNMRFSEVRALNAPLRMATQLEPGRVITGGAQASVCTFCR